MDTKPTVVKRRMYQDIWERLKTQAAKASIPLSNLQPQLRIECSQRLWRTIRKAVQKEKYMDENFRLRYQYAKLNFHFVAEPKSTTGILVCRLDLNERPTLDMFENNCQSCRGTGVVPVVGKLSSGTVACPMCHPYGLKEQE